MVILVCWGVDGDMVMIPAIVFFFLIFHGIEWDFVSEVDALFTWSTRASIFDEFGNQQAS